MGFILLVLLVDLSDKLVIVSKVKNQSNNCCGPNMKYIILENLGGFWSMRTICQCVASEQK